MTIRMTQRNNQQNLADGEHDPEKGSHTQTMAHM